MEKVARGMIVLGVIAAGVPLVLIFAKTALIIAVMFAWGFYLLWKVFPFEFWLLVTTISSLALILLAILLRQIAANYGTINGQLAEMRRKLDCA